MNKDHQKILEEFGIDKTLEEMQNLFKNKKITVDYTPPKSQDASSKSLRINFNSRRISTFFTFLGCAFKILFTGNATLLVKRK